MQGREFDQKRLQLHRETLRRLSGLASGAEALAAPTEQTKDLPCVSKQGAPVCKPKPGPANDPRIPPAGAFAGL